MTVLADEDVFYPDEDDEPTEAPAAKPESAAPEPDPDTVAYGDDDEPATEPAPRAKAPAPAPDPAEEAVYERLAKESGWVPEGDWKKDHPPKGGFKTAREWVQYSTDMNNNLRTTLTNTQAQYETLQQKMDRIEAGQQQVVKQTRAGDLAAVKQARNEAIEKGDVAGVEAADRAWHAVNKRYAQPAPTAGQQPNGQAPSVVADWQAKNTWYGQDQVRTQRADDIADWAKAQGMSAQQMLATVDRELAAPATTPPSTPGMEAPTGVRGSGNGQVTINDLTPGQQEVARAYARAGTMTVTQYIAALVKDGTIIPD